MSQLSISLLGTPKIALDGVPIKIPTFRAIPLIAYLALTGQSQLRESLASLLWTDSSQKRALAALRTTLWRLKSVGLGDWIVMDRNEIVLNPQKNIEVDVVKFKTLLERCNTHGHSPSQICLFCTPVLTEAIELYRGKFMTGFNISKALIFDDWRMQQSETLETLYLNALERLVRCHRTFGDFNLAIHYARVWLSNDRLNENVHFQLLQLYAITDQRTSGISLYKHYKETLLRELGIEPSKELTALYKQIVSGHSTPATMQKVKTPVFLIADIEKAALYWAQVGDKKNDILSAYTNIVKETARRFGGLIIQRSDNNITLLFENGQPLHCAVTIHLKLKKADWGDPGPPNIRMVLYSTILEGENPDNFAVLTHTASSLLSISWGGQIVFTDQTLRLLDLPAGSNIKDLGFHFLNETDGSIHVYELLHPHLPTIEHPPLQSSPQQLINFPILDPPFIDREHELEELAHLLMSPKDRIISLVGPGGVGKTRLAVQVASQVTEYFPDGIYFISFTSIEGPEFIPILLADVLKFSFYGPTNHLDQLRRYLHRMKVLLMIDNFEHLRVEGAKLLGILLAQTQYLKILVTSRERLNMIAETTLEVNGLPVPASTSDEKADSYSSIRLFLQNAQRTFSKFSYSNNREAIIRICQLVDGIPLGILLASSWVRVFNCPEIASEIKKNIDFLTTSAPDIDPRHRSLNAVFDNSWKLLSEEERRTLRRLSIFQAAFTTNAAQEICNTTQLLLSVFADKSLLTRRQDDRFEMLSTFHQYASGKLEEVEDELITTKAKFCNYYADFCLLKQPELNSTIQFKALSEMTSEIENIRTAWGWMVDSDRWDLINKAKEPLLVYHIILGNITQGGEFFYSALQKLNKLNNPELDLIRASMQQLSAWMSFRNGFLPEALQGLTECLEIFRSHNSSWDIAMTLFYLAEVHRTLNKLQQAKNFIQDGFKLMQGINIPKSNYRTAIIANFESVLGTILLGLDDFEQAHQYLQDSLSTHKRIGTLYGTIHPLMGLGWLAYLQGDFLQARDLYLHALETAYDLNDQRDMVLIHNRLGAVYELIAYPAESYHHVLLALKFCQETGDHRLTAVTLNNLAYKQLRYLHQPAESISTYHKCLEIFSSIGDLRGITYSSYDISKAYLKVGLLEEAWNYCIQSLNTARTLDSTPLILHALHGFANLFAHSHRPERALRLCNLIANHPQVEPDTQKRAIVSKAELETSLPPEIVKSVQNWGKTTDLQDVINQILAEKTLSPKN
jgi:predicted ATPase/DNA-binding SARP family transcriptional activator